MVQTVDMGGDDLVVNSITTGVTTLGTISTGANTLGTSSASSNAITVNTITGSNANYTTISANAATVSQLKIDSTGSRAGTPWLSSNATLVQVAVTKNAGVVFPSSGLALSQAASSGTFTIQINNANWTSSLDQMDAAVGWMPGSASTGLPSVGAINWSSGCWTVQIVNSGGAASFCGAMQVSFVLFKN